jgi:hypothetical protein
VAEHYAWQVMTVMSSPRQVKASIAKINSRQNADQFFSAALVGRARGADTSRAKAVNGYDTTGDGRLDAFDTDGDGRIDLRTDAVRAQDFAELLPGQVAEADEVRGVEAERDACGLENFVRFPPPQESLASLGPCPVSKSIDSLRVWGFPAKVPQARGSGPRGCRRRCGSSAGSVTPETARRCSGCVESATRSVFAPAVSQGRGSSGTCSRFTRNVL